MPAFFLNRSGNMTLLFDRLYYILAGTVQICTVTVLSYAKSKVNVAAGCSEHVIDMAHGYFLFHVNAVHQVAD